MNSFLCKLFLQQFKYKMYIKYKIKYVRTLKSCLTFVIDNFKNLKI